MCPSIDSEEDAADESPPKRGTTAAEAPSKCARMKAHALRHRTQPRCFQDFSGQQEPPPDSGRRKAEEELRSLLASSKVRQILEELDKLSEFQMPKPKGRKGLIREEHGTECAEI